MKTYRADRDGPLAPLVPHGVLDAGISALGLLALWVGLGLLASWLWVDPSLPAQTPLQAPPPAQAWYLLAAAKFLELSGGWGALWLALLVLALGTLPFWDRSHRRRFWWRRFFSKALLAGLGLFLLLSLWGLWGAGA